MRSDTLTWEGARVCLGWSPRMALAGAWGGGFGFGGVKIEPDPWHALEPSLTLALTLPRMQPILVRGGSGGRGEYQSPPRSVTPYITRPSTAGACIHIHKTSTRRSERSRWLWLGARFREWRHHERRHSGGFLPSPLALSYDNNPPSSSSPTHDHQLPLVPAVFTPPLSFTSTSSALTSTPTLPTAISSWCWSSSFTSLPFFSSTWPLGPR